MLDAACPTETNVEIYGRDLSIDSLEKGHHDSHIMTEKDTKKDLRTACFIGDLKCVQEIISSNRNLKIDASDQMGRTALHLAASKGHVEVIKELLKSGCSIDKQDEHGNTALHECAWRGFSQSTEELCKAKVNYYIKNKGAFTPLHLACQNGHNQSCRIMLLAGCKPDVKNGYGDTSIHTSARYGHAGVMRILISAKANLNECNKNGDTGLHISAAMCKRKLTRILLESGCDPNIRNKQGEKSIDIAKRKEFLEVGEILSNPPPIIIETTPKDTKKESKKQGSTSKSSKDGESADKHKKKNKHRVKFEDSNVKHHKKCIYKDEHGAVSPYGCHFSPSMATFPQPKLDSLPKDPLQTGEQYFLDLAGNIKKGPVGVGYACYCIPFFQQVEKKLEADKNELLDHIDSAHDDLNDKISSLERRTRSQLFNITQTMKEKLAGEKNDCLDRVERRTLKERLELEKQQEVAADYIKTELKSWVQAKIDYLQGSKKGAIKNDYSNLGAIPKQFRTYSDSDRVSKSEGDLTVSIPGSKSKPSYDTSSNNASPNSNPSESGYDSRVTPNSDGIGSVGNQPDIISNRPVISHNAVGLPNSEVSNCNYNIPEPEFRITRQFFDTVSNQMEKWYERRLFSMEKKTEEKTEQERLVLRGRIQAIEKHLTTMTPVDESSEENSSSLV